MSSNKSFLASIYFLYIFGKFFGISCYTISKGQKKYEVSFGLVGFSQLVAFLAAFSILIYCNFTFELKNYTGNTRIFNQAQKVLICCSLLFLIGGITQIMLMRCRYWEIANRLHGIDTQMMKMLKTGIDNNNIYRYAVIHVCISYSALLVVYTIFGYYSFFVNGDLALIAQYIAYVIINGTFTVLTIQLQIFMYSMYLRFSKLNEFFECQIQPQTELKLSDSISLKLQGNIIAIARLTDELNSVVPMLISYFLLFMVSAFLGIFCLTVFNFHNHYRKLFEKNNLEYHLLIIVYDLVGFMFNVLSILNIAISGMNTSEYVSSIASYVVILIQFQMYANNQLTIIEWKKSGRSKATLDATYDAPLQLCAYLGALNCIPEFQGRIRQGMVVIAYENGNKADVYKMNEVMLRKYWRAWLTRLHEFWIRSRDDTLEKPI